MSLKTKANANTEDNNNDIKKDKAKQKDENIDINSFLENITTYMFNFFRVVGLLTIKNGKFIKRFIVKFYNNQVKHLIHAIKSTNLSLLKKLSKHYKKFYYKLCMFIKFFIDAYKVVAKAYNEEGKKGFFDRSLNACMAFFKGIRNNTRIFKTAFNYLIPVVSLAGLIYVINLASNLNFAISVEYNNEHIGYVQDEAVYAEAEEKMLERMVYLEDDKSVKTKPKFTLAVVSSAQITSGEEITNNMIKASSGEFVDATGIKIDGKFLGAVKNGVIIEDQLNGMLDKYRSNNETEEVRFAKDVKLEKGFYLTQNIVDEADIIDLFSDKVQSDVYYTVKEGDTPSGIADKHNMALKDLVSLNPDILTNLLIGRQVLVSKSEAFLPVSVIKEEQFTESISFTTEYTPSNQYLEGTVVVTKQGENGEKLITAKVEYIDGIAVAKTIINERVTKEPVAKKAIKGTKIIERIPGNLGGTSSQGFISPFGSSSYRITSYYGPRRAPTAGASTYHRGIDLQYNGSSFGQPIRATMPGKVVFSGYNYGLGNHVIIDHGNGIRTVYAHASALKVRAGQYVKQGEHIANVGNSGTASGVHLHYEVRVNGVQVNPLNYLP